MYIKYIKHKTVTIHDTAHDKVTRTETPDNQ